MMCDVQGLTFCKKLGMASIKKIQVVFTTKTGWEGSGQLLTSL